MSLLPLPQLQSMLQVAQKFVSAGQVMEFLTADVALVVKFLQGEQRAARTQPGLRASVDPLQTLH